MPILAGAPSAPPGPPAAPVRQPDATWYAPDGTVWPLMNPSVGWVTIKSPAGLDDDPISVTTDARPRGGAQVRHIQPQPRIITWPLRVWGDTSAELTSRWRALADAFTQTQDLGPGILEVARPGAGRRRIRAYYQEGFDDDVDLLTLKQAIITLFCEDPYWFDPTPVTITRRHSAGGADFLDPYPTISSSQVLGATTLTNPGRVTAWPEWIITGPASQITATLTATGDAWTLDPSEVGDSLAAGDRVHVATDPPRVRLYRATKQTIDLGSASGGTFTITFDGHTTDAIDYDATAAAVQAALEALPGVEPGDVVVTGGPLPGEVTIAFGGRYAGQLATEVTVDDANLTGATVTVDTPAEGEVVVWTGALNWPNAVLWGLPRGESAVDFQVDGAADGTSIAMSFHPRYRTT